IEPTGGTSGGSSSGGAGTLAASVFRHQTAASSTVVWPTLYSTGIVNAADYSGGGVSPGEVVAVFGEGLCPVLVAGQGTAEGGVSTTSIAGVRVLFDGVPASLLFVSAGQI